MVESHHWVESHLFSTSKVIFSIKKNKKNKPFSSPLFSRFSFLRTVLILKGLTLIRII